MPYLILAKHSLPEIVPSLPANEWRLSEEGRSRCRALAESLAAYWPNAIISSVEPKAQETAQIIADLLNIDWEVVEGLHEHDRSNTDYLSQEQFEAAVAEFFARPDELVFGKETANQAYERFAAALGRVIERYRDKNLVVVTHGTVLTLFVARAKGLEPFPVWESLDLPSFIVLDAPSVRKKVNLARLTQLGEEMGDYDGG